MRGAAILGCILACSVASADPDGFVAEPARWCGPNGPAGHTRRSRAMPVVRDVAEAWSVKMPGEVVCPPVTWDGKAYLLCTARRGHWLVAVDVSRGELVAKKMLVKAPRAPIHVWGGIVCLAHTEDEIAGYKRVGRTFVKRWEYGRGPSGVEEFRPEGMVVWENEIYVVSRGDLIRVAPGHRQPVWSATSGILTGTPAVCGDRVLVVGRAKSRGSYAVHLYAFKRRRGARVTKTLMGWYGGGPRGSAGVTVGRDLLLARSPRAIKLQGGKSARFAFVRCSLSGDDVRIGRATGFMDLEGIPAAYKDGLIARERDEWQWWHGDKGALLAKREWTPDLFEGSGVPPTVLGPVVYFGTWAADAETGEVLWRLPIREVLFGAVPADRLVLVVANDHTLRAYRARVGR